MNTIHVLISYLFMVHFLATFYIHLGPIVTASVVPPPPKKKSIPQLQKGTAIGIQSGRRQFTLKVTIPGLCFVVTRLTQFRKKTWFKSRPRSGVVT